MKKRNKKSLSNLINTLLSILYSRQFAKEKIEILTFQIFIKVKYKQLLCIKPVLFGTALTQLFKMRKLLDSN